MAKVLAFLDSVRSSLFLESRRAPTCELWPPASEHMFLCSFLFGVGSLFKHRDDSCVDRSTKTKRLGATSCAAGGDRADRQRKTMKMPGWDGEKASRPLFKNVEAGQAFSCRVAQPQVCVVPVQEWCTYVPSLPETVLLDRQIGLGARVIVDAYISQSPRPPINSIPT